MEAQRRGKLGWPVTAALLIAAAVLYRVHVALSPFAFALIVGFITDPLIRRVQTRTGWPRAAAAGVIYVAFLLVLIGVLYFIGLSVAKDAAQLLAHAPEILRYQIRRFVGAGGVDLLGRRTSADQLSQQDPAERAEGVELHDGQTRCFGRSVLDDRGLFPDPGADRLHDGGRAQSDLGRDLANPAGTGGRASSGCCRRSSRSCSTTSSACSSSCAAPSCSPGWGGARFCTCRMPCCSRWRWRCWRRSRRSGRSRRACSPGAASLQALSLSSVGFTIVDVIALRLFVDNVVCPLVLGRATALPPVVVIFALAVGGLLFGLPGFLLAVPAAAVVRIVLKAIYEDQGRRAAAEGGKKTRRGRSRGG